MGSDITGAAEGSGDTVTPKCESRRFRIFGSDEYYWLWIAQVISAFGDWIGFFAITALAATISSQPGAAVAFVITARVAPSVVLAPVLGVVIDRFDRKKLMIMSDVARAGIFCFLPFVHTVPGLVVASLFLEVFTLIWGPSKEALVPSLVPAAHLTSANSLGLVAAYGTMPIAGLLQFALKQGNDALAKVSFLGPFRFNAHLGQTQALAFYVDALSFLATAIIVWRFVLRRRPDAGAIVHPDADSDQSGFSKALSDIREGWKYIFTSPVIRSVHVGLAAGLLGGAMLIPLGPLFAQDVIGDTNDFALFITALGIGVALGVSLISALQVRLPKRAVFVASLFVAGIALIVAVSMSSFWLASLGVAVLGICAGSVYVLGFTMLHEETSDELRGRIFSTLTILVRMCVLLALWLGPILAVLFDGIVRSQLDTPTGKVPAISVFGVHLAVPGSRLTLWLAGVIIIVASVAAARSMQVGVRSSLREIRAASRRADRGNDRDDGQDEALRAEKAPEAGK